MFIQLFSVLQKSFPLPILSLHCNLYLTISFARVGKFVLNLWLIFLFIFIVFHHSHREWQLFGLDLFGGGCNVIHSAFTLYFFLVRFKILNNNHLQIRGIKKTDEGSYTCEGRIKARGEIDLRVIKVIVNGQYSFLFHFLSFLFSLWSACFYLAPLLWLFDLGHWQESWYSKSWGRCASLISYWSIEASRGNKQCRGGYPEAEPLCIKGPLLWEMGFAFVDFTVWNVVKVLGKQDTGTPCH